MADERTYIRVHDGMPDHPKVDGLSDAAFRLLLTMWCWCSRHLTDGRVPAGTWKKRGSRKARAELLAAGLVVEAPDGVIMRDYLEHQRSAEEVAALKAERRSSGAAGNHKRWHVDRGITDPDCDHCGVANGSQERSQTDSQTSRKSSPTTETDTEKKINPSSSEPAAPADPVLEMVRDDVEQVCRHLADRIEANGSKRPTVTKAWRQAARLLLDRDERTVEQILTAIDWCQADDFWRGNVLSMPKLREKYDQLRLAAGRARASPKPARPTDDPDYWDRAMSRAQAREATP